MPRSRGGSGWVFVAQGFHVVVNTFSVGGATVILRLDWAWRLYHQGHCNGGGCQQASVSHWGPNSSYHTGGGPPSLPFHVGLSPGQLTTGQFAPPEWVIQKDRTETEATVPLNDLVSKAAHLPFRFTLSLRNESRSPVHSQGEGTWTPPPEGRKTEEFVDIFLKAPHRQ